MFYKMRRFKQELSSDECIKILGEEKRGVLSLIDEELRNGIDRVACLDLKIDHLTGKIVKES